MYVGVLQSYINFYSVSGSESWRGRECWKTIWLIIIQHTGRHIYFEGTEGTFCCLKNEHLANSIVASQPTRKSGVIFSVLTEISYILVGIFSVYIPSPISHKTWQLRPRKWWWSWICGTFSFKVQIIYSIYYLHFSWACSGRLHNKQFTTGSSLHKRKKSNECRF